VVGVAIWLLVVGLTIVGVGYGLWSKTLTVAGTVHTGNVDGKWLFWGCFDLEPQLPDPKDVGTTTAQVDPADPAVLLFTVTNGYPSYTGDCEVEYTSVGSVPVKVERIEFLPGPELTGCTVHQSPSNGSFTAVCDQLTVWWADGLCTQLDPGDFVGSSLRVHVEQNAQQGSTYNFQVKVQLVQWNESQCS